MGKISRSRGPTRAGETVAAPEATYVPSGMYVAGELGVGDGIEAGGPVLTNHDRLWWAADVFGPDDGAAGYADLVTTHATAATPPYWAFDATAVERIKWVWSPGDGWDAYTIRVAWVNPLTGTGDVVWRYSAHHINFASSLITAPAAQPAAAPAPSPNGFGTAWRYTEVATAVPVVLGGVSEVPLVLSVLERLANDAGDTFTEDAGVWAVSATRAERA